jgi:CheY-like chemotaxis protein
MGHGLALVWVAPERNDARSSGGNETGPPGNGHPTQLMIIVVEDEVLIRLAVCDYLRGCGYCVLEATDGKEAQSIFRAGEPIEVLFSDIDLGSGMSGLELATSVREHYPAVRIVLTSGVKRIAEEATNLCDGPLLQKPYSFSALEESLVMADKAKRRKPSASATPAINGH